MSSIKKRILEVIDNKGITKYRFYKESGMTRGVLDKPGGISEDNIVKFVKYYADVDVNWLITGQLKKGKNHSDSPPYTYQKKKAVFGGSVPEELKAIKKEMEKMQAEISYVKEAINSQGEKTPNSSI
jgi:hypothetical protein